MRWAKVIMIALGALIAFIIIESVFHLLQLALIALVIGAIIALAVKARSQYKLAQERRTQVRQDKVAAVDFQHVAASCAIHECD